MNRKILRTLSTAAFTILVTLLLSACGGDSKNGTRTGSQGDVISANIALLDVDRVPDHDLRNDDSLLRFEATVTDLGRLKIGRKKNVVFTFANVGKTPVVITRIVTTCGCTSADYEKSPLMPGKESKIRVGFEPEGKGVFFKKLFIYYAGGSYPLEIAIKGEVR